MKRLMRSKVWWQKTDDLELYTRRSRLCCNIIANADVERFNTGLPYGFRALLQDGKQVSDSLKTLLLSYRWQGEHARSS